MEAQATLDRLYQSLRGLTAEQLGSADLNQAYIERFTAAMDDDFNTPEALAVMFDLVRELNIARKESSENIAALSSTLRHLGSILGILESDPESYFKGADVADGLSNAQIDQLVLERTQARTDKNWAESDRIRDLLLAEGITLDDSKDGTSWRRS